MENLAGYALEANIGGGYALEANIGGVSMLRGADGITPTIGENGTWYLGDTDTGKPSRGETGPAGADGRDGSDGQPGADGVGIQSVVQTTTSTEDGGTNVVTVTKTDGTSSTLSVKNGSKGSTGQAGANGADGKSAYAYAVEGGYTGTETAFSSKLAEEQLTGTTHELTPTQVREAVSVGIPVKVQYTHSTYGIISFTAFTVSESLNMLASNMIIYYNGVYILVELVGNVQSGGWGFVTTTLAQKTDIPAALPNPNALTFTGSVTGSYDGSNAKTVNIPSAVTDDHINSLIDTKLGVIENGAY